MKLTYPAILFSLFVVISCSKPNKNKPVITLAGESTVLLFTGDKYTDAGATAYDEEDKDVSNTLKSKGFINTSVAGNYTLTYTANDKLKNEADPVTRTIKVKLSSKFLTGYYSILQIEGTDTTSSFDFITSGNNKTDFSFYNLAGLDSVYLNANLSGELNLDVNIPSQTVSHSGNSYTLTGSGTVKPDGKSLEINYTKSGIGSAVTGKQTYTWISL